MSFYLRNKPAAYDVDQTSGTTPVWQQLANLDQAKSNYGAIVYNKAPGILKQLNYLVGDSAFRAGLHDFLIAHAYGNATWQDLLASIGKAAHRPLTEWGRQYILRPGLPVTEQVLETENGTIKRLALIQHPAQSLSGRGVWPMRTEVVLWSAGAAPTSIPVEVRAETTVVAAAKGRRAPDFAFANANDQAYGLVMARSPKLALAARARRRCEGSVPARDVVGRAVGPVARGASRAGGVHRVGDSRAAERTR
jgi:aminopeptidase N